MPAASAPNNRAQRFAGELPASEPASAAQSTAYASPPWPPGVLTPSESVWLYGYLAMLQKPILGDTASTLRQLFVSCREQRAALQAHAKRAGATGDGASLELGLASINVLIAVIGRHFDQRLPGED